MSAAPIDAAQIMGRLPAIRRRVQVYHLRRMAVLRDQAHDLANAIQIHIFQVHFAKEQLAKLQARGEALIRRQGELAEALGVSNA
ncbi:MAG: hypothetical protein AAFV53_26175 [Myxococcota bacterium]